MNPITTLWKLVSALALIIVFVIGITASLLAGIFRAVELWAFYVVTGS